MGDRAEHITQAGGEQPKRILRTGYAAFALLWIVTFVLYLPAAEAGRVGDFPGWVRFLNSVSFIDYINRSESGIPGMYQFTQVVTYVFYLVFHGNAWGWHLLFITLQALNALMLYLITGRIFMEARFGNSRLLAITGALFFCICPHISEVVVWESAFHYLLGLLLIFGVLYNVQQFLHHPHRKYVWAGGIIFLLATFSLEVFYLTPFFVISIAWYYYKVLGYDRKSFTGVLHYFTLPQAVIFILYLIILKSRYHSGVAHIEPNTISFSPFNFSKPLKYIFHILFFGRFFPEEIRKKVYSFSITAAGLASFYTLAALVFGYLAFRFRKMQITGKTCMLLFVWVLLSVGLTLPLWFPETGLVIYDRYSYVLDAFIYVFLAALVYNLAGKKVFIATFILYAILNIRFTYKVNSLWRQSAHIVNSLVTTFPNDTSRIVLMLNLPECLQGVQMIGSRDDGEFRMMYNAIMPHRLTNTVYDVEAYYMQSPTDGAHVTVLNDSSAAITLNQWGTWWLYYGFGASDYENSDYKVIVRDGGHWYQVILKHPASRYLLLYEPGGDHWKAVDWSKKNVDQF